MIWAILAVATILRLINLNQSLWLDEAINILAAKNSSFWDMVTKYPIGDFHPPGYFVILWIWTHIFGYSEAATRIPSVIFGVLAVWLIYLLGNEMINKRVALLSAFFLAIAPLHVYYSQEARMYSMATFSVVLSFYFFWKVTNRDNLGDKVGFAVSGALILYSDYLVYLIFPAQLFYLIFFKRESLKNVIIPWIINLILVLPWLFIFPKQLKSGASAAAALPGWKNVVGGSGIKELLLIPIKTFFGRVSIDNKQIYGLVIGLVGLFYCFIISQGLKKLDHATKLLICWLVVPIILAFLISFYIPVLSYFRMIFILPALYLLLAKGIDILGTKAWPGRLALSVVCLISAISLAVYYTNPKFQREDWRGASYTINRIANSDTLILFEDNGIFSPYTYYTSDTSKVTGGLKKIPATSEADIKSIPGGKKTIYLFEYLVDVTDPKRLLQKNIENSSYRLLNILNFNGVGFVYRYTLQY